MKLAPGKPWLVWLSWLECCPVYQKVAGSVLGQGSAWVVGSIPGWWGVYERKPVNASLTHLSLCLSVSLSLPTFLPHSQINYLIK